MQIVDVLDMLEFENVHAHLIEIEPLGVNSMSTPVVSRISLDARGTVRHATTKLRTA